MKKYILIFFTLIITSCANTGNADGHYRAMKYVESLSHGVDFNKSYIDSCTLGNSRVTIMITEIEEKYTTYCVYIDVPNEVGFRYYYICVGNSSKKILSIKTYAKDYTGRILK